MSVDAKCCGKGLGLRRKQLWNIPSSWEKPPLPYWAVVKPVLARLLEDGLSPEPGCFLAWVRTDAQMCELRQEEVGAAHPCTGFKSGTGSAMSSDSGKSVWPGTSAVTVVGLGCKAANTYPLASCLPSFPSISEMQKNLPEFSHHQVLETATPACEGVLLHE